MLLFLAALLTEAAALLAFWTRASRRWTTWTGLGLCSILVGIVVVGVVLRDRIPSHSFLAFAGVYILSGLLWKWCRGDEVAERLNVAEIAVGVLAIIMISSSFADLG